MVAGAQCRLAQTSRYFIDPELLRSLDVSTSAALKRIKPHRLAALMLEDLQYFFIQKIKIYINHDG